LPKRQFFALTDLRGLYVLLVSFPKNENHQKGSPLRDWQFPAYNVAPQNRHGSAKQKIQRRTSELTWLDKTKSSNRKSSEEE
jgi:hypothetical protein